MTAQANGERRACLALLATPMLAGLLMCLAGWWPTQARAGQPGLEAMILAQTVLLAVLYATLLPIMQKMTRADSPERLRLAMRAAGQRFMLTLLAAGTIAWWRPGQRKVFLLWIAVGYVVMTLAETIALVRWMRKTENRACT